MVAERTNRSVDSIDGISLASFLQVLEQERKTCTVNVECGKKCGALYFNDGELIDAEYENRDGIDAAYTILSWDPAVFTMDTYEDRIAKISQSLSHVILTATTLKDEKSVPKSAENNQRQESKPLVNPVLAKIEKRLIAIPGVRHYFILNKQGKMMLQSMKNQKIVDFIAYCIVSGVQMREVLDAKGLHNIRIKLEDDNLLLIVPANSITIALLLRPDAVMSEVYAGLRNALSRK